MNLCLIILQHVFIHLQSVEWLYVWCTIVPFQLDVLYVLGELNSETRMKDDKEKYYVLWMEATMASQLRNFSANNTLASQLRNFSANNTLTECCYG